MNATATKKMRSRGIDFRKSITGSPLKKSMKRIRDTPIKTPMILINISLFQLPMAIG
jgi:hypothetical protein